MLPDTGNTKPLNDLELSSRIPQVMIRELSNFRLLAIISTESTRSLDLALDRIGGIKGIDRTTFSILLSTKFER